MTASIRSTKNHELTTNAQCELRSKCSVATNIEIVIINHETFILKNVHDICSMTNRPKN